MTTASMSTLPGVAVQGVSAAGSRTSKSRAAGGAATPRRTKLRLLKLTMVKWQGFLRCCFLHGFRVVGGKPFGGGDAAYEWDIQIEQLQAILQRVRARGESAVLFEVYEHPNRQYAVYIDNELMKGARPNSVKARPRRVGSVLVMQTREVALSEFANAHDAFMAPS